MPRLNLSLAVCFALVAASCASNKELANKTEFKTRITDTGLKHFQLGIIRPKRDLQNTREIERPERLERRQGQRPSRRPAKQQEKQLFSILEEELTANQFCREGFWIIDKNFMRSSTFIRGECNENATEADRVNYPNTILRW